MKYVLAILLTIVVTCSLAGEVPNIVSKISSEALQKGLVLLNVIMQEDGGAEAYMVTKEQVSNIPEWDGKSNPPLEVAKALEIARAKVLKEAPGKKDLLSSVAFHLIYADGMKKRWYYKIDFQKYSPVERGYNPDNRTVYVLMSGTVVKPKLYNK